LQGFSLGGYTTSCATKPFSKTLAALLPRKDKAHAPLFG